MGHMPGMDMSMPLLPTWVRVAWALALLIALIVHLSHVYRMSSQYRLWVLGHVIMAAAMIPMYMPEITGTIGFTQLGLQIFVCAAFAAAAVSIVMRLRENVLNPLWAMLTLDLAIMAYMWLPTMSRLPALDVLLAVYFSYQVLAWILGIWDRLPVLDRSMAGGRHRPAPAPTVSVVSLTAHTGFASRATSAVMAASMGYMLIAM
jgi:hypothetical protein